MAVDRAGALPVRLSVGSGSAFLVEPDFVFSHFFAHPLVRCKFFLLDGSDRPYVVFILLSSLWILRFSVLAFTMCELEKNKKRLSIFKKSMFPPSSLHASISSYLICMIFYAEASRLRFSFFERYIEDFLFYRIFRRRFCDSGFSCIQNLYVQISPL